MAVWQIVAIILVLSYIAFWSGNLYLKARASRELMQVETAYKKETEDYAKTILVLGDSTGAGVGAATPEESVAGRLSMYVGATHVENYAVSGAETHNLPEQIAKAKLPRYDLILIQIGGNDILWLRRPKKSAEELKMALQKLPEADQVIVLTAGNVGGATIFPPPIRPFHTWRNQAFHREFAKASSVTGATYVNLYEPPHLDPFLDNPELYLAEDGLHPSSEGYKLWFGKVQKALAVDN